MTIIANSRAQECAKVMLVGCKSDLPERRVQFGDMEAFKGRHEDRCVAVVETSAKDKLGLEDFRGAVLQCIETLQAAGRLALRASRRAAGVDIAGGRSGKRRKGCY
jgi:hypothetical protein